MFKNDYGVQEQQEIASRLANIFKDFADNVNDNDDLELAIYDRMRLWIIEKNIIFSIINAGDKDKEIPYKMLEIRDILISQLLIELYRNEPASIYDGEFSNPYTFLSEIVLRPNVIGALGLVKINDDYLLSYDNAVRLYKEVLKEYYAKKNIIYDGQVLPISKEEQKFVRVYQEHVKRNKSK